MMLKHLGIFAVLAVCLFAMAMGGCRDQPIEPPEEAPIKFVSADPAEGSTIQNDAMITVTFDGIPEGLKVTGGTATPGGKTVSIAGPFATGPLVLGLQWEGEVVVLSYTVEVPPPPPPPPPEGMVLIPAGSFQRGSRETEDIKFPVHTVHLDAFYMDVYEVTNEEFYEFVAVNSGWTRDRIDPRFHDGNYLAHWEDKPNQNYLNELADHPVEYVSWYAAMAYATSVGKRLPTEAEWEYAARGGLVDKKYPWGDAEPTPADANYDWNVGDTVPVGQYPANGYGLYDMAGNVEEWCLDAWDRNFYAASPKIWNPIAGGRTVQWIVRNFRLIPDRPHRKTSGGGWIATPLGLEVRGVGAPRWPIATSDVIGFRCVKDVPR